MQEPPMMEQPPMQGGMGTEMPPMQQDAQMMPPAQGGEGQYDADFDAGVEVDEEQDPKKFIQQLTGKLSQSLRSYNENLPQTDVELNKYVAGMVIKQAVNGLSGEDKNEILSKVETDSDDSGQEMDGEEMPQSEQGMPNANESKNHGLKNMVNEIFNDILNGDDDDDIEKKVEDGGGEDSYRQRAFRAPSFES